MFEADALSQTFLKEQKALWQNTHKLEDMIPRVGEFDAIFYVGGHGRTFPFPKTQDNTTIYLLSKRRKGYIIY
jgi:putative intracellular protease/amidase